MPETVALVRGIYFDRADVPPELKDVHKGDPPRNIEMALNPLSSFSADEAIGRAFARKGTYGPGRFLITASVPRDRIFSTARSGLGCLNEGEVVVLGGKVSVTVQSVAP